MNRRRSTRQKMDASRRSRTSSSTDDCCIGWESSVQACRKFSRYLGRRGTGKHSTHRSHEPWNECCAELDHYFLLLVFVRPSCPGREECTYSLSDPAERAR